MSGTLLVISKYLPEYTGAAFRLHGLYKRLQPGKVSVLCTSTSETKSKTYEHEGIFIKRVVFPWRLEMLPSRLSNALKVYYEAFFSFLYLLKYKPSFLHIAGYSGATMAALIYGRLFKVPRLIELVTKDASPFQYLPGLRYGSFLKLDKATIIVAISQNIAEMCFKRGLKKNIWCRPNPIDQSKFNLTDEVEKIKIRSQISPFSKDDYVISMVAKFMPQKNQIFLLDVLKGLPENYKLLLAGPRVNSGMFKERDEVYFQEILDKVSAYQLESRVHIQDGFVEASQYMKASDVYVMPQYSEGLGTPMLEAIACGVPVIANKDEAAFQEWIKDGDNGYLAPLNAELWQEAFKKAVQISKSQMSKESFKLLSYASVEVMDKQYLKIFKALHECGDQEELRIKDVL